MNNIKLIPCPFCGWGKTVEFTDALEMESCKKALDKDCCCDYEPNGCQMVAVVCNVNKGGCGASSGYAGSYEEAAKKWNSRIDAGLTEAFDIICTMHQKHGGYCGNCPVYDDETENCYKSFEKLITGYESEVKA